MLSFYILLHLYIYLTKLTNLYQILFVSPRKDFIIKEVRLLSISHGCMKKYCLGDAQLKK